MGGVRAGMGGGGVGGSSTVCGENLTPLLSNEINEELEEDLRQCLLPSLKRLDVGGNALGEAPKERAFDCTPHLQILNLRRNLFLKYDSESGLEPTKVLKGFFHGLNCLKELDVRDTGWDLSAPGVFDGLAALEKLSMSVYIEYLRFDSALEMICLVAPARLPPSVLRQLGLKVGVFNGLPSLKQLEIRKSEVVFKDQKEIFEKITETGAYGVAQAGSLFSEEALYLCPEALEILPYQTGGKVWQWDKHALPDRLFANLTRLEVLDLQVSTGLSGCGHLLE